MACANIDSVFQRTLARFTSSLTAAEQEDFQFTTLEEVHDVIHQIQETHGSERRMRNMNRIKSFLEAMEQYGQVIEVFLNVTDILAFIWGPVKFLLQVASTWSESLDILLDTYERIGEEIPQLLKFQSLFHNNQYMRKALELIYGDILEFHRRALRFFKRPTWKQLFRSTWKTFETQFQHILSSLSRHKSLIESRANSLEFEQSLAARAVAQKSFKEIEAAETKRRSIAVTEKLRPSNCNVDQEYAAQERAGFPQAGRWLLRRNQIREWMSLDSNAVISLWLNGIPGAGKTVLASLMIEEIRKIDKASLAFFYCKHGDNQKNSFLSVLRSTLAQLVHQDEHLLSHVYERCSSSNEVTLESLGLLKELMSLAIQSSPYTYVLIDGLDECETGEAKKIVTWFNSMLGSGTLRLLYVSQRDNCERLFGRACTLSLDPIHSREHQKDIESYASHWSSNIGKKFELSSQLVSRIAKDVAERSKGMFLFAKLVLTNLYDQTSKKRLMKELEPDVFPTGLDKAYERIVNRVYNNPVVPEREDAARIISWVVCARRPLKWNEIQAIFSTDVESQSVDFSDRLRVTGKDICGSLVDIRPGDIIELVHETARLYLIHTGRVSVLSQEVNIAVFCIKYFSFECFKTDLTDQEIRDFLMRGSFAFQDYAAAHWIDHLEYSARNPLIGDDLDRLGSAVMSFLQHHWIRMPPDHLQMRSSDKLFECFEHWGVSNQLEVLAHLAHSRKINNDCLALSNHIQRTREIFENLIITLPQDGADSDIMSSYYGSGWFKCPKPWCDWFYDGFPDKKSRDRHVNKHEKPFYCTFNGCPVMGFGCETEYDLKKHVSKHPVVQGQDWKFPKPRTAKNTDIFKAAASGDLRLVESLLDQGADINGVKNRRDGQNALYFAVLNNHIEMVKLLLAKGAVSPKENNLLVIAASSGQCEIWLMLSDTKPPSGTVLLTSLDSAALNGHEQMVQMLLNSGVVLIYDFNPKSKGITSAKRRGHESIVQQLSSHVTRRRENHTAYAGGLLRNAVVDGNASKLRLMKSCFSMTNYDYSAGLCIAARNGHEELVRILLLWARDLDHLHDDRCTALQDAVFHGHESVAQLLIDWGFNINAKTPSGETLLLRAVTDKSERMIRFLLDRGADVNMTDQKGELALYYAVRKNDIELVRLLLDHGAVINVRTRLGKTPLMIAVLTKSKEVVQLLLDKGALVNMTDGEGESALYYAVRMNEIRLIGILLDYGADINARYGKDGYTVLHTIAMIGGTVAVLHLLLQRGAIASLFNAQGETALHVSCISGSLAVVQVLSNDEILVNMKSKNGKSALHMASKGYEEIARLLIDRGAYVMACDDNGGTPLHEANTVAIAYLLLVSGADINARALDTNTRALGSGLTPLEQAVNFNNTALAELFLEKGATIFEFGPLRRTLLEISAESGNVAMTRLLLKHGAIKSGITQDGETLLHRLAVGNSWEIIELLVKVSVDISASAKDGWTPLHAAAALGNWKSVQVLLENGATVASQTALGETALQLAALHGHQETVLVLLEKGADVQELSKIEIRKAFEAFENLEAVKAIGINFLGSWRIQLRLLEQQNKQKIFKDEEGDGGSQRR